jgi:hypothetical protein
MFVLHHDNVHALFGRLTFLADISVEAPPSVLPQKHYCDITGLEVSLILHLLRIRLSMCFGCAGSLYGPSHWP